MGNIHGGSMDGCLNSCDICPCVPPSQPTPPPIVIPKVMNVGEQSSGVWDTTLNRQGIQPIHD